MTGPRGAPVLPARAPRVEAARAGARAGARGWARATPAAGLLALLLALLGGCGAPRQAADCDELLSQRKFQDVLDLCKAPYERASAYMALGGFDLITIYNQVSGGAALDPAGVIKALGLTPANVTTKRQYFEKAVLELAGVDDAKDAFALLVASAMGMMVSSIEFLDNGQGGGTALDGVFTQGEGQAAMGISPTATPTNFVAQPATYFSGVVTAPPALPAYYAFLCPDIALGATAEPLGGLPFCNSQTLPIPPFTVFDPLIYADSDATYGSGAGFQAAAAVGAPLPSLQPANPVSLVFLVTDLTLPFAVNAAAVPVFNAFSGRGNAAQTFSIGIEGYLSYLQAAQTTLTAAGSAQGSSNTLSDAIDAFKGQLDNGAVCLSSAAPPLNAIPAAFNAIYPIYQKAIGTSARPMPAAFPPGFAGPYPKNFFAGFNQLAGLVLGGLGIALPPLALPANQFVFGIAPGTVVNFGTRFLYPKLAGVASFDPTQATPRIDETPVAFQQAFEAMLLAPAVSPARDGNISYAELLCIGAGPPPTGVTATAAGGKVNLAWNASAGATGYTVYRHTAAGVTQTTVGAVSFPSATNAFTDATGVVGTTYHYVITSTNASGEGGISREVTATP